MTHVDFLFFCLKDRENPVFFNTPQNALNTQCFVLKAFILSLSWQSTIKPAGTLITSPPPQLRLQQCRITEQFCDQSREQWATLYYDCSGVAFWVPWTQNLDSVLCYVFWYSRAFSCVICLLDNGLWYKFCVSWIVFSDMCSVSLGQCSVFCVSWTAWESWDPLRLYYTSTTAKTTPITFHYAWHCRPHAWLSFTFENHKSTISIDQALGWMKFERICDKVWSNRTGTK